MPPRKAKKRLDTLVTEQGLAPTRQRAKALIMAGRVLVNGERVEKPGREFPDSVVVSVKEDLPYVSRGGVKLASALDLFQLDPQGMSLLDAGASTGGFTDCLLQRGAVRVIAVDVGYGQLDWRIRNDPRVSVMERTNLRKLEPDLLPHTIDAAVADLSFISLRLVLPTLARLIPSGGWLVPLVKPQFEVGRDAVGKGGVVRDRGTILTAVNEVGTAAEEAGFLVRGQADSVLKGPKGNQEVFLHLVMP